MLKLNREELDINNLIPTSLELSEEANPVVTSIFGGLHRDAPDNGVTYSDLDQFKSIDFGDLLNAAKKVGSFTTNLVIGSTKIALVVGDKAITILKQRIRDLKIVLKEDDYKELVIFKKLNKRKTSCELAVRYHQVFKDDNWDIFTYQHPYLEMSKEELEQANPTGLSRNFTTQVQKLIDTHQVRGDLVPTADFYLPVEVTNKYLIITDIRFDKLYKLNFDTKIESVTLGSKFFYKQLPLINNTIRLATTKYSDYNDIINLIETLSPQEVIKYQIAMSIIDVRITTVNVFICIKEET